MDGTGAVDEWPDDERERLAMRCGALAVLAWHGQARHLARLLVQAQATLLDDGPIPGSVEAVVAELDDVRAKWVALFTSEPWLAS